MSPKKEKFEDHLKTVEDVVRTLESGKPGLDESMRKYETGVAALKKCYKMLEEAELKIQQLIRKKDGSLETVDFEGETESVKRI